MTVLDAQLRALSFTQPMRISGVVAAVRGLTVHVRHLPVPVGSLVSVRRNGAGSDAAGGGPRLGEVVGFAEEHAIVMLLGTTAGIRPGDVVVGEQPAQTAPVGASLLGRVIDGLGRAIDGRGPVRDTEPRPIQPAPIAAMARRRISEPLRTGVRAIDLMTPLGRGQRIGVFAGPGVGKSTLLAMIARRCSADVSVIALVGERGREVGDFVAHTLGPEGLRRSVVVAATGDESPLLRVRAALTACTVAEHFRGEGKDVLLIVDSVTRFAHAQRQIGLSVGEPPASKGYTPSVFSALSLLLERAGAVREEKGSGIEGSRDGSITGVYSVLVEGDDMTEPVADAARGILDGHVILSRRLAQRGHYPAIDVLDSVSRVAEDVADGPHLAARQQVIRLLSAYRDVEELLQIGAYVAGANAEADVAIALHGRLMELLQQGREEAPPFAAGRESVLKLAIEAGEMLRKRRTEKGK